jgi:hypothetical protein
MKSSIRLLLAFLTMFFFAASVKAQEDLPFKKELVLSSHRLASRDIFRISKQLERVKGIYFWEYHAKENTLTITYDYRKLKEASILPYLTGYIDYIPSPDNKTNIASQPGIAATVPVEKKEIKNDETEHPVCERMKLMTPLTGKLQSGKPSLSTPVPFKLAVSSNEIITPAEDHPVSELMDYMIPVQISNLNNSYNVGLPAPVSLALPDAAAFNDGIVHPVMDNIGLMTPAKGKPLSAGEQDGPGLAQLQISTDGIVREPRQDSPENIICITPLEIALEKPEIVIPEPVEIKALTPSACIPGAHQADESLALMDPVVLDELPADQDLPDIMPVELMPVQLANIEITNETAVSRETVPIENTLMSNVNIIRSKNADENAIPVITVCEDNNTASLNETKAIHVEECIEPFKSAETTSKIIFAMREPIKIYGQPDSELMHDTATGVEEKQDDLNFLSFDAGGNIVRMAAINVDRPSVLSASSDKAENPSKRKETVIRGESVSDKPVVSLKKELLLKTDELSNYDVYVISKQLESIEGVHFWGYHVHEQTLMISYETDKVSDKSIIFNNIGKVNRTCLKELTSETFYAFIDRTSKQVK